MQNIKTIALDDDACRHACSVLAQQSFLQAEEGEDEEERGQERDDDERSSAGEDRHHHGCNMIWKSVW